MSSARNRIKINVGDIINECVYWGDEPNRIEKNGKVRRISKFECRCGNEFVCHFHSVKRGLTSSCGCVHKKIVSANLKTHGLCGNKLAGYSIWVAMVARCTNKTDSNYLKYGAKGIKVCDRWLHSFESFHSDMGDRPSLRHTLDRFPDKNGNYEPGNCRWATYKEQANNKNNNLFIEYKGEVKTLAEWCDIYSLKYKPVHKKYKTLGWGMDDIINYYSKSA